MIEKIKNRLIVITIIAGILYLILTIYGDIEQVLIAFRSFNWLLLPLLLLLSLMNYLTRFYKWDYYLSVLNIEIKKIDSLSIFAAGLVMSITPGKMGELLKSFLVKQINGTPVSKTAPIIFVERITDFVSLIIIALLGAFIYDYGRTIVLIVAAFFVVLLIIIGIRQIALSIIKFFEKVRFFKKHLEKIHNAYESSYLLLRPLPLFYMTLISLLSWSFECLGYHIILLNFGIDLGIFWGAFSYAFATIVGAITMLPAGLGVTEGSLTFLIINEGFSKDIAVASTFIVRVVTLWFAVLVGVFAVALYQNRYGKITIDSVSNK